MAEFKNAEGIKFKVIYEGKELVPEEDGYLGRFWPLFSKGKLEKIVGHVWLDCRIERDRKMIALLVDGRKNVSKMRDHSPQKNFASFSMKIPVKKNDKGELFTAYPINNFRLLELRQNSLLGTKIDGDIDIWEIAVIGQNGQFFLTKQHQYRARCFLDGTGKVVCPRFTDWPQLLTVLQMMRRKKLLPLSCYEPESPIIFEGNNLSQGEVVWWSPAKGLGAIVINGHGTYARVHWSEIKTNNRLKRLWPGQVVSYQNLELPRQDKEYPSGFPFEARVVSPVV